MIGRNFRIFSGSSNSLCLKIFRNRRACQTVFLKTHLTNATAAATKVQLYAGMGSVKGVSYKLRQLNRSLAVENEEFIRLITVCRSISDFSGRDRRKSR